MSLQASRGEGRGIRDPVAHPLAQVRLGDGQGPRGALQALADMRHSPVYSGFGPPRPGPPAPRLTYLARNTPSMKILFDAGLRPTPEPPEKDPKAPPVLPIFHPGRPRNAWRVGSGPPLKVPSTAGKSWRAGQPTHVQREVSARESVRHRARAQAGIVQTIGRARSLKSYWSPLQMYFARNASSCCG